MLNMSCFKLKVPCGSKKTKYLAEKKYL